MAKLRLLLILLLALLLLPGVAAAQTGGQGGQPAHGPAPGQGRDPLADVAFEQRLGAQLPLERGKK